METLFALLQPAKPLLLALLLPPSPMLLLIGLGTALLRRSPRLGWALVSASAALLWLSCTEFGAEQARQALLGAPQNVPLQQLEQLSGAPGTAILVLGGGARQDSPEYAGATLNPLSLERLRYGVWLARRTGLALAYTGGIGRGGPDWHQAEGALASLTAANEYGLPLLFAESQSRDTRENAQFSAPLLQQHGIRQVVLVTHVQHMPRALRAFAPISSEQHITVVPAAVGLRPADAPFSLGDALPSSEGFRQFRYAIYEWLGWMAGH